MSLRVLGEGCKHPHVDVCKHPHLDVRAGHKCPICMRLVHVFCGVADPNAKECRYAVTCNTCIGLSKKNTQDTTKAPQKNKKKEPATKANAPAKKAKKAITHRQATELVPAKLKKTPAAKAFRLTASTGRQDPLIIKSLCFLADDGEDGTELVTNFGQVEKIQKSLCSIDRKLYLFGNVARPSKLPKKGNANVVAYNVE